VHIKQHFRIHKSTHATLETTPGLVQVRQHYVPVRNYEVTETELQGAEGQRDGTQRCTGST